MCSKQSALIDAFLGPAGMINTKQNWINLDYHQSMTTICRLYYPESSSSSQLVKLVMATLQGEPATQVLGQENQCLACLRRGHQWGNTGNIGNMGHMHFRARINGDWIGGVFGDHLTFRRHLSQHVTAKCGTLVCIPHCRLAIGHLHFKVTSKAWRIRCLPACLFASGKGLHAGIQISKQQQIDINSHTRK